MTEPRPIYLDHNATTPLLPEVVDAMLPFLRSEFGNPSSDHPWGHVARAAVERAREQVAALLGGTPDEIVFTSGGTEANNLAIRGVLELSQRREVVTSVIEHPATANPCRWLESHGATVVWMPVDAHARVRLEVIESNITESTALVTVMHANNETGTLQPIRALADRAHACGALVHTDAAQSVGKLPVDVNELGVDLLSVAGHKLNAPKGVGALYVRRNTRLAPFVLGAGHERGIRPGTENVASLVGLGVACAAAAGAIASKQARAHALRERLHARLARDIADLVVNGADADRLPNTLSVRFPRVRGSQVLAAAPEIAASTGSACHAGHESASSVLLAMGVPVEAALGTVRLSVGVTTTEADVDAAAAALVRAWRGLQ